MTQFQPVRQKLKLILALSRKLLDGHDLQARAHPVLHLFFLLEDYDARGAAAIVQC